jgi:hypothetical protein
MAKEKICGIYCIENLVNSKKYIGQSKDIYTRWYSHKFKLNNNSHYNKYLQNAWNKYGENNFKFYIVEECLENELDNKEIYYISYYNSYIYTDNKQGYNLTIGGEGVKNLSEEGRQIFREAHKSIPIYQIDFDGNIVNTWQYGAREASKKLNIGQSVIWTCVNKSRKTYKNFIWISVDDYNKGFNINDYLNQNTQPRKILQYTLNGEYVKTWDSATQTENEGFDGSSVIKCCKGKIKYHKGYIFKYKDHK